MATHKQASKHTHVHANCSPASVGARSRSPQLYQFPPGNITGGDMEANESCLHLHVYSGRGNLLFFLTKLM